MGARVISYALIGSKLEKEHLFTKQTVKIGNHNFSEDIKFHPQTGKPLWRENEVPIPELNDGSDEISNKCEGLKIEEARGYEGEDLGYYFYKDAFLKCSDSSDEVLHKQLTNISELENEICNKLAKIGLSVEASKTFGLHLLHLWS
jgi:hypothetical protein